MSTEPHRHIRPPTPGTDQRAPADPVAALIAAAAAPAPPGRLPGEEAALAAFQQALLAPAPRPGRKLAKLVTVKAALIAGSVVLAGSVALAASAGVLPNPLRGNTPPPPPVSPTPMASAHMPTTKPPSPALLSQCAAYLADARSEVLDTPAFAPLVTAAGGKDKVAAYCAAASANPPGGSPPGTDPATPIPPAEGEEYRAVFPIIPTPSHPTGSPSHPTGGPEPKPSTQRR